MLVTFDLDGVIADSDRWFFNMFNVLGELIPGEETHPVVQQYNNMELDYYKSRQLKYHPNLFMTSDDLGYIITARKPHAENVTREWLKRYGISLTVVFVDCDGDINWLEYEKASIRAAKAKAEVIKSLRFRNDSIHFDNNPFIIRELRRLELPAVLVGGASEKS